MGTIKNVNMQKESSKQKIMCDKGGVMLGSDAPIAGLQDPAMNDGEMIACGALVCRRCAISVKMWDGFSWKLETPTVSLFGYSREELNLIPQIQKETPLAYDAPDMNLYLKPFLSARAYACRCTRITMIFNAAYAGESSDYVSVPWICSGHSF